MSTDNIEQKLGKSIEKLSGSEAPIFSMPNADLVGEEVEDRSAYVGQGGTSKEPPVLDYNLLGVVDIEKQF